MAKVSYLTKTLVVETLYNTMYCVTCNAQHHQRRCCRHVRIRVHTHVAKGAQREKDQPDLQPCATC